MDCADCQYGRERCHPLLYYSHRFGGPCNQGKYIKGRAPVRQVTLAEAVPEHTEVTN